MKNKVFISIFSLLVLLAPQFAFAALSDNTTSYWKMDESSGNRVDTVSGFNFTTGTGVTAATGWINNGISSGDWSSASLAAADQAGLRLNSGSFTICTAVKTSSWSPPVGSANFVMDKQGASDGWGIFITSGGTPVFQTNNANNFIGTGPLPLNQWDQLCIVNNAGSMIFYINGALDTAGQGFSNPSSGTQTLQVGQAKQQNRPMTASATMDEFGIWSRALSATEITTLWNSGAGCQYSFTTCGASTKTFGLYFFSNY